MAASETDHLIITNVTVFDGVSETVLENVDVVIEGNVVKKISTKATSRPE